MIAFFAGIGRDSILGAPNTPKANCSGEHSEKSRREELEIFKNFKELPHRRYNALQSLVLEKRGSLLANSYNVQISLRGVPTGLA
jgi:hypothetical protein